MLLCKNIHGHKHGNHYTTSIAEVTHFAAMGHHCTASAAAAVSSGSPPHSTHTPQAEQGGVDLCHHNPSVRCHHRPPHPFKALPRPAAPCPLPASHSSRRLLPLAANVRSSVCCAPILDVRTLHSAAAQMAQPGCLNPTSLPAGAEGCSLLLVQANGIDHLSACCCSS